MKINFNPKKVISEFAKYSSHSNLVIELGATLIGNILVGIFLGIWLGGIYQHKTLFIVLFMIVGLLSGFYQVWKISYRELEKIKNAKDSEEHFEGSNNRGDNNSSRSDADNEK